MKPDSEFIDDYDWQQAFGYADFDMKDVAEIIQKEEGCNDGERWIIYGTLNDGRYFFVSAGCDYTGWDCQSWGDCATSDSLETLIRMKMDDDARERFGLRQPT